MPPRHLARNSLFSCVTGRGRRTGAVSPHAAAAESVVGARARRERSKGGRRELHAGTK